MILSLFLVSFSVCGAVTLGDIVGEYEVTMPNIEIVTMVDLSGDGKITIVKKSLFVDLTCQGYAEVVEESILESRVVCENGLEIVDRIDFKNVSDFDKFSAPVYSSLYDMNEVVADFKLISK